MSKLRLLILIVIAVLSIQTAWAVDVYFTSCTNGELENCRCPANPLGSREKIVAELGRLRALGNKFALVDAGNFNSHRVDSLRADAVLEAMKLTGYDAVTLGFQDFKQGRSEVEKMLRELPVVCANAEYNDGSDFGDKYKIVDIDGEQVFITALLIPETLEHLNSFEIDYFKLTDPDLALEKVLKSAPEGATVVLLLPAGFKLEFEYATKWSRVDLIVGGHDNRRLDEFEKTDGAALVKPGANGRYLGMARLKGDRIRSELIEMRPEMADDPGIIDVILKLKAARHAAGIRTGNY